MIAKLYVRTIFALLAYLVPAINDPSRITSLLLGVAVGVTVRPIEHSFCTRDRMLFFLS